MTKPKHTPGPWTIEPHGKGFALYSGRGPMMHGLNLINMAEPDKNWEANARLIVAAPEMLLALKEAFESLAAEDGCNIAPIIGSDNPHEHATGLVQAAISKAEAQP